MSPWLQQFEHNIQALGFSNETVQALSLESPVPVVKPDFKCRQPEQFQRHLHNFMRTLPGLEAIYDTPNAPDLKKCCDISFKYPRLLQQLQLLEQLNPAHYYHALFSALAGFAVAKDVDLNEESRELAFLAGLYHDIGFLAYPITPAIEHLNDSHTHDPAIRVHGAVGAGMVKRLSRAPQALCDIIRDHHERNDGTGYPRASLNETNDITAIVAVTDLFVRATNEYSHYPLHCHQLTRCILQLHNNEFPHKILNSAINLTKHKADITEPPSNQANAGALTTQGQKIAESHKDLNRALNLLIQYRPEAQNVALRKLQEQLLTGIHNIGIEQQEYAASNEALENKNTLELVNLNVFQNEMCHLIGRLFTVLHERTSQLHSHEKSLKIQLHDILERIQLPSLITPKSNATIQVGAK